MNTKVVIDEDELNKLSDGAIAVDTSPTSALGKRNAYSDLVKQQRNDYQGECFVTLYSLLTSYSIGKCSNDLTQSISVPPLLVVDKHGTYVQIKPFHNFQYFEVTFTRLNSKNCV